VEALEKLAPELAFKLTIICGPSPAYIESLRAKVSPALWQRIEFKHHILPHEVARELATPVLMLLPTRADVSPNAVKEAVVAGVPVVASEVGGIPDYVTPEKNGFLFPAGDLDGFVNAIRKACSHPLFGRGEVDDATLSGKRGYLAPARMAENFLAAYRIALGEPA
jgi:glycosyltransferase involved in cell wall biosynthesis